MNDSQTTPSKQIADSAVIKVSADQLSCDLDGEAAVLHLPSGQYFGLQESGARIWELAQQSVTFGKLLATMLEE